MHKRRNFLGVPADDRVARVAIVYGRVFNKCIKHVLHNIAAPFQLR